MVLHQAGYSFYHSVVQYHICSNNTKQLEYIWYYIGQYIQGPQGFFYHSIVVQYHICSNNTKQLEYIWYYTRLGIVSITVQYSTIYALITQNNQNIYGTTLGWVQFVVWYHICSNNTKQLEYIWYVLHQAGYSFYHSVVQYHICSNNTKQLEYIWYYTRLGIVSITVQYSTIYALITQNNQNIYGTTLGNIYRVHKVSSIIVLQYSTIYALITQNNQSIYGTTLGWVQFLSQCSIVPYML